MLRIRTVKVVLFKSCKLIEAFIRFENPRSARLIFQLVFLLIFFDFSCLYLFLYDFSLGFPAHLAHLTLLWFTYCFAGSPKKFLLEFLCVLSTRKRRSQTNQNRRAQLTFISPTQHQQKQQQQQQRQRSSSSASFGLCFSFGFGACVAVVIAVVAGGGAFALALLLLKTTQN